MARFTAREWKNCATCEFWVGPRDFNELLTAAEVDVRAEGVCALNQKRLRRCLQRNSRDCGQRRNRASSE